MLKRFLVFAEVKCGRNLAGEAVGANRAAKDEFAVVPAGHFDGDAGIVAIRGDLRQVVGRDGAVVCNVLGAAVALGDGVAIIEGVEFGLCHGW